MTDKPAPAFFLPLDKQTYQPTEATIGPWSPTLQHGGPPAALLTHALQQTAQAQHKQIARITIEIFRPIPVQPCQITVETVRGGKRIELLRAWYLVDGTPILMAHAWLLEAVDNVSPSVPDPFVVPALPPEQPQQFFPGLDYFPYGRSLEWRFVQGSFVQPGPATVWARARIPLVEGSPITGLESLMLMLDSANGISAELDLWQWTFVPVDLSIGLQRMPVGEWVGVAARTMIGTNGIGQTTAVSFDQHGTVGHSIHTLFVRPRQ